MSRVNDKSEMRAQFSDVQVLGISLLDFRRGHLRSCYTWQARVIRTEPEAEECAKVTGGQLVKFIGSKLLFTRGEFQVSFTAG